MELKDEYKTMFSQVRPVTEFDPEEIYMKATNHKPKSLKRAVIVGVVAALIAVLSITAVATELFNLNDFIPGNENQTSSLPEEVSDDTSPRQLISLSGFAERPEAQAQAEWKAYYNSIDFASWTQADWDVADASDLPEEAVYYNAANQEMYNKLLEIADKHGLELLQGNRLFTPENPAPDFIKGDESVQSGGYCYSNGSFKAESVFTSEKGETIVFTLHRHVYGSIMAASFEIWDAENWTQWNYETEEGRQVALGLSGELYDDTGEPLGGNRGLIMADLGNCAVSVLFIGYEHDMVTEEEMNEVAALIDFERLAIIK